MDHLARPLHPTAPFPRILNRCDEVPYDGGDFYAYPARVSRLDVISLVDAKDYAFRTRTQYLYLEDIKEYEKFLQSWIFFGLLHHFLSPFDSYDHRDYIEDDVIHTRLLTERFDVWRTRVNQYDTEAKIKLIESTQRCWQVTMPALTALDNTSFLHFDQDLRWCLVLLCHSINNAVRVTCASDSVWKWTPYCPSFARADKKLMIQHGWCISEIIRSEHKYRTSSSLLWYLRNMSRSGPIHSRCSIQRCWHAQIDHKYQVKHVLASCDCVHLVSQPEEVLRCLDGSFPVIDSSSHDMRVFSAADLGETSYVAVSHVWADGLGNPDGNALPACQIARLRVMATALEGRLFNHLTEWKKYDKLHLWIDSICVPIQPEARLRAINLLREVYSKAAYVLVVDEELMQHNFEEIGTMEAGTRFINARYMSRLWTFQEAGLADKLIIQFRDGPVDSLTIRQAALRDRTSVFRENAYSAISLEVAHLRAWQTAYRSPDGMFKMVKALCRRQVSVSTDEAICAATIYGFPIADVANGGMQQLWSLLGRSYGISESVIFSTQPRLDTPGYRWAAATFLQPLVPRMLNVQDLSTTSAYFKRIGRDTDGIQLFEDIRPGVLTSRGLRVRRPGWKIKAPRLDQAIRAVYEGISRVPYLTFVTSSGEHYNIMQQPQDIVSENDNLLDMLRGEAKEWYIILEKTSSWSARSFACQKGLVVSAATDEYGLVYHRSRMVVIVSRLPTGLEVSREADFLYAESVARSWTASTLRLIHSIKELIVSRNEKKSQSWVHDCVSWCYNGVKGRFVRLVSLARTEAIKLPHVARLMQTVEQQETVKLGGQHVQALKCDYLEIVERFADVTEWYVD